MINRCIVADLQEIMETFPALALLGPRQVGKTTLAKVIAGSTGKPFHYFDLEDENDLFVLKTNPKELLKTYQNHVVIIDEIQLHPPLFTALRSIIDEHRVAGRFILLGSANPALVSGVSESLAGRVIYHEVNQISLGEAQAFGLSQEQHWFRGGFPEALLFSKDKAWKQWTDSFIQSYVFRDLNLFFGIQLNSQSIQRLWSMLAHLNSEIENNESLGRSLGITGTTIKKYAEYMEGAFLIRKLQPWYANLGKRLVKSPKVYLRTPGILHFLLGISSFDELQKHPGLGASWEAYVVEQVATRIPKEYQLYYYRTQNGAEIDLVIVKGTKPIAGVEIKYTNSPKLSRGFYESIKDLELTDNYVITPNSHPVSTPEGIKISSLSHFLTEHCRKWD